MTMTNTTHPSLMEFPCCFPVKIIGLNNKDFIEALKKIALKHFPEFKETDLSEKPSQKNNYLAVTLTVFAQNQKMLDALYQDLTKIPQVKMVL